MQISTAQPCWVTVRKRHLSFDWLSSLLTIGVKMDEIKGFKMFLFLAPPQILAGRVSSSSMLSLNGDIKLMNLFPQIFYCPDDREI